MKKKSLQLMSFSCIAAAAACMLSFAQVNDSLPAAPQPIQTPAPSFIFAPEYNFDETFLKFFNPKNDSFRERYFLENSLSLQAAFFSKNDRYFFWGEVIINFDMGRQSGAILLDPREVDMGFGPVFEYRMPRMSILAGLDHHCFHQIDRSEWNTLYWNKLFLGAGSRNFREGEYKKQLSRCGVADWTKRLSWQCTYGHLLHKFFGLLDTNALSWGHAYVHEIAVDARWTFFRNPVVAVFACGQNRVRVDRGGRWLWMEKLGMEAMTMKGEFGMSLFVNWVIIDQSIVRENRDRLVTAGIRVFR